MTDTNPPGQAVGLWADDANIAAEIDEAVPRAMIGATSAARSAAYSLPMPPKSTCPLFQIESGRWRSRPCRGR
jgi:hypothetical protein